MQQSAEIRGFLLIHVRRHVTAKVKRGEGTGLTVNELPPTKVILFS